MSGNRVVVPIKIEGKFCKAAQQVAPALADFTRLPWNDGLQDINFNQPFMGEGIMHEPFESGMILNKGMHLHFILPHYLGRHYKIGSASESSYPAAPNRWLVLRNGGAGRKTWLIQSDYIYEQETIPPEPTCIIPNSIGRPYLFMGRKLDLGSASNTDLVVPKGNSFKSLNRDQRPLTALGYGHMNFSSFYPNCHGVFGFHDSEYSEQDGDQTYAVIGWIDDEKDDVLSWTIKNSLRTNPNLDAATLQKKLEDSFSVRIPDATSVTQGTLFAGTFSIEANNGQVQTANFPPNIGISIGNTGTEALSAALADKLATHEISTSSGKKDSLDLASAKSLIEDQLEALQLLSKLDHLTNDTLPKFREARHEKGFRAVHPGHVWKIVVNSPDNLPTSEHEPAIPQMPDELGALIHSLNEAQTSFDKAADELSTLQHQLYADWCKYMRARYPDLESRGQYPDPDDIQLFLENHSIVQLEQKMASTGQLDIQDNGLEMQPSVVSGSENSLASELASAWEQADKVLKATNKERIAAKQPTLHLGTISGSRFWEPKPPVILFFNLGSDNLVDGSLNALTISDDSALTDSTLNTNVSDKLFKSLDNITLVPQELKSQNWNPIILDWEVELTPPAMTNNRRDFAADSLKKNFVMNPTSPEFQKNNYIAGQLTALSGSVLLSGHARKGIEKSIETHFRNTFSKSDIPSAPILSFLSESKGVDLNDQSSIDTAWNNALATLDLTSDNAKSSDFFVSKAVIDARNPYFIAWLAYGQLPAVASQALSGFNDACIMLKKIPQLPVREPIGFDYQKEFTERVAALVGNHRESSPIMGFDFNPLRCGALKLSRLNLVDTFGAARDIPVESVSVSESMRDQEGSAFLWPRLTQPARLNLRWLSANSKTGQAGTETNDHTITSPICGWLVANYVDNEIAVYDSQGHALGFVSRFDTGAFVAGKWNTLPWSRQATDLSRNIKNPYLRNVVRQLCSSVNANASTCFLDDFITTTQAAMDNISPANAAVHNIKSILMGRPMAVVRSQLSFQVKGEPAINQNWPSFVKDLSRFSQQMPFNHSDRNSNHWLDTQIPVRLGEYHQLNDGLVGYWAEDSKGNLDHTFVSPELDDGMVDDTSIANQHSFPEQWLTINGAPAQLTMLMDPRGVLHATSGLVPTKAISIPPQHYLDAMNNLEMWFRTSPLLQPSSGSISLELPKISKYTWQWWDAYNGNSSINSNQTNLEPSKLIDGWLILNSDSQPEDQ